MFGIRSSSKASVVVSDLVLVASKPSQNGIQSVCQKLLGAGRIIIRSDRVWRSGSKSKGHKYQLISDANLHMNTTSAWNHPEARRKALSFLPHPIDR